MLALMMLAVCLPAHAAGSGSLQSLNLKQPCHITAEQLETGLLYDLKPYAQDYIDAYERTGINPVFLAAKDALESGWGRYPMNEVNISGFYTKKQFESVPHVISYVSDFIDEEYLTETGRYFRGYTVSDINVCWNGRPEWGREVLGIMAGIYRRMDSAQPPQAVTLVEWERRVA